MNTIVVDTSVIVKWLNQKDEEYTEKADELLNKVRNGRVELIAPELAKYEVGNVLLFRKKLIVQEAELILSIFYSLPITFVAETEDLAKETFNLAYDLGITYYDASFLSLAKQYNATLITQNIKHQGKTKHITVKSLAEY